jgi:hypothetical protein
MKKIFNFRLNGIDIASLDVLLRTGLKGYATNASEIGGLTTFWCWLCDGSVLQIHSVMNDIDGWDEIGTLVLRLVTEDLNLPAMMSLSSEWESIDSVEKLVLDEVKFLAESGILIRARNGEELMIVCGANVYSIQIAASFFFGEFQAEYEITTYKRTPLINK